jgi:hypothetical protein
MIRAHQPGSQPIDIPEAIPNPAVPQPVPAPTQTPKEPVKAPAPQNAMSRSIDRANGESSSIRAAHWRKDQGGHSRGALGEPEQLILAELRC